MIWEDLNENLIVPDLEAENSEEVIADDTTETQIADESETEGDVE